MSSKQGEIEFRQKLASQQHEGETAIFTEAHTHEEILKIMKERASVTRETVGTLLKAGVNISPYLELGAERCQRALLLENEFDVQGIAIDISFDMLRFAQIVGGDLQCRKGSTGFSLVKLPA